MAEKMIFKTSTKMGYQEMIIEYQFYPGFALSQKRKCIQSIHDAIHRNNPEAKVLEISSASMEELGVALSAFNLQYDGHNVENVYHSSKVFEAGGPYIDLLDVSARNAKRDERLKNSGEIIGFRYKGVDYPINPPNLFYDWIWVNALNENKELGDKLMDYDYFTDIMFNHKKSKNCQARSAAIYVSLRRKGVLEDRIKNIEAFKTVYRHGGL